MVRRKREPEPEEPEPYWGLTPNQVIAFNLARAREAKGWTLNEAAEALEPYVGSRWSKANLSAAERSIAGERIRNFDADEIVAFARAFGVPIAYLFMPPPPWAGELATRLRTPDAEELGHEVGILIDLIYGDPFQANSLNQRMEEFLRHAGSKRLTYAQQRVAWAVKDRVNAILRSSFADLGDLHGLLLKAAERLRETEIQANKEVREEMGVEEAKPAP